MRRGRVPIIFTAGFCISMAISLCILPLNWVCGWLLAMTVHEFCHCVAVWGCGGIIRKIRLTFLGAEIYADTNGNGREIVCSLAGPVGGLLLLVFHKALPVTAICTVVLSVFNLLPLRNFDGGRTLFCLLRIFLKHGQARVVSDMIDMIVRILLFVAVSLVSWRVRWGIPVVFAVILLFRKHVSIKSACKHKRLQVQ